MAGATKKNGKINEVRSWLSQSCISLQHNLTLLLQRVSMMIIKINGTPRNNMQKSKSQIKVPIVAPKFNDSPLPDNSGLYSWFDVRTM
jgi:hypothetical protein